VSLFVLTPFASFGPLKLGASRSDVRAAMDEEPREFFKGEATTPTEAYNQTGLHAHYDAHDRLELVEAFSPCRATYASIDLLNRDARHTLGQLRNIGLEPRDDHQGGLWFPERGFALYAPNCVTEGVSVFRRGYDTGT